MKDEQNLRVFNISLLTFFNNQTLFYFASSIVIISFLLLVIAFIISDFSLQNVFLHSSTIKPMIFKISAAWASYEGSILLWYTLLTIISCGYLRFSILSALHRKIVKSQETIMSIILLFFLSFIYFTSSSFQVLSTIANEGMGLNPMLQDIALSIHPPILYLGYVSYLPPFITACVIIIFNTKEFNISINGGISPDSIIVLLRIAKFFSNIGIILMTLGIGIGSWWAYRELGWGGFWFFDPVENVALLPWISGIALHHSLVATIKSGRLIGWSLFLSVITFLLVICGTFLVRSGLLISVHSFAFSPLRSIYILLIFSLIAIPSIFLFMRQNTISVLGSFSTNDNTEYKVFGITIGNILWMSSIIVLLCATIYPIIYYVFYKKSISIDTKFFMNSFIPIVIVTPVICAASIYIIKNIYHILITFVSVVTALVIFKLYNIKYHPLSLCALISSIFLVLSLVCFVFHQSQFFTQKLPPTQIAMLVSHFGFALLILSITMNSALQNEVEFIGKIGDTKDFSHFNVTLKSIRFSNANNYYRQIVEFWVQDYKNSIITILNPENRFYIIEKTLSQESDIYSYLTHDIYAVLGKVDGDIVYANIYYRPMISFIWISVFIMSSGFLISLINRSFYPKDNKLI